MWGYAIWIPLCLLFLLYCLHYAATDTAAFVHTEKALRKLEDELHTVPTLKCDAEPHYGAPPHHLEGCSLKVHTKEGNNSLWGRGDEVRAMAGSFYVSEEMKSCTPSGKTSKKMFIDGEVSAKDSGQIISFFGNVSGNALKPWSIPSGTDVCMVSLGEVGAAIMIAGIKKAAWKKWMAGMGWWFGGAVIATELMFLSEAAGIIGVLCFILTVGLAFVYTKFGLMACVYTVGTILLLIMSCVGYCFYCFYSSESGGLGEGGPQQEASERTPLLAAASQEAAWASVVRANAEAAEARLNAEGGETRLNAEAADAGADAEGGARRLDAEGGDAGADAEGGARPTVAAEPESDQVAAQPESDPVLHSAPSGSDTEASANVVDLEQQASERTPLLAAAREEAGPGSHAGADVETGDTEAGAGANVKDGYLDLVWPALFCGLACGLLVVFALVLGASSMSGSRRA